jgi:hypothetical protein
MKTAISKREALVRAPEPWKGLLSNSMVIDDGNVTRSSQRVTRKVTGCAQEDCLEVAIPGADHCPLHD